MQHSEHARAQGLSGSLYKRVPDSIKSSGLCDEIRITAIAHPDIPLTSPIDED